MPATRLPAASNLERAKQYLKANENGAGFNTLAEFFSPDIVVECFPIGWLPMGTPQSSGLHMSAERDQKIMASPSYEIRNAIVEGDSVALEVYWTGSLAVAFENIPAGGQVRVHFAMFLTFGMARLFRSGIMVALSPSSF